MSALICGKGCGRTFVRLAGLRKHERTCDGTPKLPSTLEREFETCCRALAPDLADTYLTQVRFHAARNWMFDVAWLDAQVAVELHGGVHSGGRHTRGTGFTKDREKMNAAIEAGWLVLEYTTGMLATDPAACFAQIRAVLAARNTERPRRRARKG